MLVTELAGKGEPIIIGVDDTIERRWGSRISARGIYRDPVRSSHGHFASTSGLRWLSFMLLTPLPYTKSGRFDQAWARLARSWQPWRPPTDNADRAANDDRELALAA